MKYIKVYFIIATRSGVVDFADYKWLSLFLSHIVEKILPRICCASIVLQLLPRFSSKTQKLYILIKKLKKYYLIRKKMGIKYSFLDCSI